MTEPSESEGQRDLDQRPLDQPARDQQHPAGSATQPYWGTMRPYWNSAEPPGVIHRGARTRGFTKTK